MSACQHASLSACQHVSMSACQHVTMSPCHHVTMLLSPCHCHHVTVTMLLSPCHCHHITVIMSLSPYHCHHVSVTLSLSKGHCHHVTVSMSCRYISWWNDFKNAWMMPEWVEWQGFLDERPMAWFVKSSALNQSEASIFRSWPIGILYFSPSKFDSRPKISFIPSFQPHSGHLGVISEKKSHFAVVSSIKV